MQIALTKKLSDAMGIKPAEPGEPADPFFVWTAIWTNTFHGRKEDLLVMVNRATRFVVAIYGVKWNQFKNIADKMETAIRNTLLSLNIQEKVVDEYLRQAGDIQFIPNHDRKAASYVTRTSLSAALIIGRIVNESGGKIKYDDTFGRLVSNVSVNENSNSSDSFYPIEKMLKKLPSLTTEPIFQYHAFELRVTLDLELYTAVRRLIVPADIEFSQFHHILQQVFRWKSCHMYDFMVFNDLNQDPSAHLVISEELLEFDETAIFMEGHKLSEFLPKSKYILYTYDMGDSWEHQIELVRDIPEHHEESPYLLEASGQTPPEDVGGVGGFLEFREVMLDPAHPDYEETKIWSGFWSPELRDWEKQPRALRW